MSALTFRGLKIRRMPGIVDGGFTLDRLASGVNIVFGPNASGKTTTARTVESLLWPRPAAPAEAWLEGSFDVDGATWWVEVDAGRSAWQRDGAVVPGPGVAPPEDRDRYRLSLHELLRADDAGFARSIMLESAGGYDLNAAARILGPRVTLSRPRREIDELRLARERLQKARGVQEGLYQQSLSLKPDEKALEQRPLIEARRTLIQLALEHEARRSEAGLLRERLARFPAVVSRLHGKEAEIAAGFRVVLEGAAREASKASFDVDRLVGELAVLRISPEALDRERLAALLDDEEELDTVHREARVEDRRAAEEKARLDAEVSRLGAAIEHASVGEIGAEEIEALATAARAVHELRAGRGVTEAELRLLGPIVPTGERGKIDRAVFLLQQWLRQGKPALGEQRLALAAGILLFLSGLGFALLHGMAILIAAAGAVVVYLTTRGRLEVDQREATEAEFSTLGVADAPRSWEIEEVRIAYSRLTDRLEALRAEESRNERRQRLIGTLAELADREEGVRERVRVIADRLGIDPSHDEFRLSWTVEAISRWQKAAADLAGALEARERAWEQESDILARANHRLVEAGLEAAVNSPLLKARIEALRATVQMHDELSGRLAIARQTAAHANQRHVEAEGQLSELLSRLGVAPEDEPRLAEWCEQRSGYLAVEAKLAGVENELERFRARIVEVADDPEALLEQDRASLEEELPALTSRLEELEALAVRVIQLRRDIENAKRGHDIEDAQADVDRATLALRAARDRDISAAIAHSLVAQVERTSRDQHLPEVFHRASAIFARITHGRYTLRLDDSGSGAFRAYDTTSERSHALEELSSATRLQLLLAVRVAFIELQERGLRLPILMDETLANSDDDRAAAIMDAVLELAENGRQIFYFTAQPDEVRKWAGAMARRPSLEGRVIDLGVERKLERRLPPEALNAVEDVAPRYPSPGFLTHSAYAGLLHVPPVDLFAPVGSLHLWYLIDEPETLHRVLQTLRAECWGQLEALAEHGGAGLLGDALLSRVRRLAEAAAVVLSRTAIGRGLPVDRKTIVASGAVTERYIDEVAALASSLDGDPEKLLAALSSRAISGFRATSLQALSTYLQENGYLDEREPIAPEDIRIEVIASLAGALTREEIKVSDIDGLLARLFAGAGAPRPDQSDSLSSGRWEEAPVRVPEPWLQAPIDAIVATDGAGGAGDVTSSKEGAAPAGMAADEPEERLDVTAEASVERSEPSPDVVEPGSEDNGTGESKDERVAESSDDGPVNLSAQNPVDFLEVLPEDSPQVAATASTGEVSGAPLPEPSGVEVGQTKPDELEGEVGDDQQFQSDEEEADPAPPSRSEPDLLLPVEDPRTSASAPLVRPTTRVPTTAPAPQRKREPTDTSHELKLL